MIYEVLKEIEGQIEFYKMLFGNDNGDDSRANGVIEGLRIARSIIRCHMDDKLINQMNPKIKDEHDLYSYKAIEKICLRFYGKRKVQSKDGPK